MNIVRELLRRRVPQILGIYLAVGWGVLEFTDWLVNRYVLSPHLLDFSLVAWATMIPTVLMLAWFHGAPGADEWTKAEKIGIPTNLVAAAILLVSLFGGKDLGAATAAVSIETDEGETIERSVPKAEFLKSFALYFFDNVSGDTALDWLQHGVPFAVLFDLQQDVFIDCRGADALQPRLRQEGYRDQLDVPLTLKREIADHLHLARFVAGTVDAEGGQIVITTSLYETRRGKLLQQRTFAGSDLFGLVDSITVQLKRDLEVPTRHIEEATDLPVSEILTASPAAYRHLVDGQRAANVENDWEAAAGHWESAVELDPRFAYGYWVLFGAHTLQNQSEQAEQALQSVMGLLYKLPERIQLGVKVNYYVVRQDADKMRAAAEMHAELFPQDIQAHLLLAELYALNLEMERVISALNHALELDPSRADLLLAIGQAYEYVGEFDVALDHYQRYAGESPDDPGAFTQLGDFYRLLGDHQAALEGYERALVIDPGDVSAMVRQAGVNRDLGRFQESVEGYQEALQASVTPEQRQAVYEALKVYHEMRGQPRRAVDYMHLGWGELEQYESPFALLQEKLQNLGTYVEAGQVDVALDSLASFRTQFPETFDVMLPLGQLEVYLALEDADSVEAAIPGLERLIEAYGVEILRPMTLHATGRVFELRGACEDALPYYQEMLELDPTQTLNHIDLGRCHRKLGNLEEALDHLTRRLEVRPFCPETHYEIALVHVERGDREKALEHLRTALYVWSEADPAFRPAQRAREELDELSPDT
jgi:tetratricopeptide (TPR) repeat protein